MNRGSLDKWVKLGWSPDNIGEIDHRLLKAPDIKLRQGISGPAGDTVFAIDLRITKPNQPPFPDMKVMHSLEHFLLEGFSRLLPDHFISVGVMGCQTGFYLILLNEGRYRIIKNTFIAICEALLQATDVPYAQIDQCGHFLYHDLAGAKKMAHYLLKTDEWQDSL